MKIFSNKHSIAEAMQELGLNKADLREIPYPEAKPILKGIKDTFCTEQNVRWWWTYFRKSLPYYLREVDYDGYKLLNKIVPAKDEKVWFVVEEYNPDIFRLYLGTVANIQKVVEESPFFEYYLVACDYSWLICETHHGDLVAVGDKVVTKFQELVG